MVSIIISNLAIMLCGFHFFLFAAATPSESANGNETGLTIDDPNLKIEPLLSGLEFPSSMAFLGPDDILVLEKNTGKVQRIVNGVMQDEPLLQVNVSARNERGLLGIAVSSNDKNDDPHINRLTHIFLYYTEAERKDPDDQDNQEILGNRLYRYEFDKINNKLINPKVLLDLPALPASRHNGGAVVVGPDNKVYVPVGDINGYFRSETSNDTSYENVVTLAQNAKNAEEPDGRAGILGVMQDGETVNYTEGILGNEYPLDMYYASGIRNSFGLDFDPVTGKLWDSENGPSFGDEINRVEPGFNSGWLKVQGIWHVEIIENSTNDGRPGDIFRAYDDELVNFNGKGKYSSPEFTWQESVGVTAIKFLSSDRLGKEYKNDLFVGDFNNGNLYHFNLNKNRTAFILERPLDDNIAESTEELKDIIFAQGFGSITDLEVNPYDGNLYVLSAQHKRGSSCDGKVPYGNCFNGAIFRIVPDTDKS